MAGLANLQSLDLSFCTGVRDFAPVLPLIPRLRQLYLYQCEFDDLPTELCGESWGDNAIERVRAHYADRELGETHDAELKACILGNGGVGKTQMSRRLRGLAFDESIPSTHGVELGHLPMEFEGRPARLNLWDFGGQDIYHGSHALFLQGQAVFVVLWNPDSEAGQFEQGGATIEHRPLSFWLDYLRGLAGTESPILVVQSKCDRPEDRCKFEASTDDFRLLRPLSFSAKTDFGKRVLEGELEDAVRDVLSRRPPIMIGQGRVEIRDQLRRMLEEDQKKPAEDRQHRTLSLDEFRNLCQANGKVSNPEALLDYLHHSGVVFYRPGLLDDKIVLDQNWALEAIYTLYNRERTLPVLNRHGRFTRRELELLVWEEFSEGEQELFLSMMESCGICFKARNLSKDHANPEWEYVAPELLPEWSVAQEWLLGRMIAGPAEADETVEYKFLHERILRGLLSKLGRKAGDAALYWKYGCWFFEQKTQSQVLVRGELGKESGAGTVTLRAVGQRPEELVESVLDILKQIPTAESPRIVRPLKVHNKLNLSDKVNTQSAVRQGQREKEALEISPRPEMPTTGKPAIYISYAWGDDKDDAGRQRTEVVNGLCRKLDEWGYDVKIDEPEMRNGDLISAFMRIIGRADHVLVILSKKYLKSPNCMTELFHIYSRSLGEKEDFLRRVIPVVIDDARDIGDWEGRLKYARHWEAEFQKMEPHLRLLGQADVERYHLIKRWHDTIGDILGFIADTLHPHGFVAITKDGFAAVRRMLPPL